MTLQPQQLVLATGMSGVPNMPSLPGMDGVQGRAASFAASIRAARPMRGKKAVVVGSNNSAHDICAALWEHGADVTMVQRCSTHVSRSPTR